MSMIPASRRSGGPDPVVAEATRNGFVESVHLGRVVGLDRDGETIVAWGEVKAPFLLRSSAKPLQAVAMLRAGLNIDGAQLAVAAASHDGTSRHLDHVRELLSSAQLDASALQNTPMLPIERRAAAECLLAAGPDQLHHNCSGKHAAMLATCVVNGWPIENYLDPAHPLQRAIVATVEELTGEAMSELAVDGCGAPIGAVSLIGLARSFARLATANAATAEGRVAAAMREYPIVVGGATRDVTLLMQAVPRLVAKDGAEGSYAAALDDGRAVAIKIGDGSGRARQPVMVAALRALGIDTPELDGLAEVPILGHGRPVGAITARPISRQYPRWRRG